MLNSETLAILPSITEKSMLTNEVALYQLQSQTLSYPIALYQLLSYRIAHVFDTELLLGENFNFRV